MKQKIIDAIGVSCLFGGASAVEGQGNIIIPLLIFAVGFIWLIREGKKFEKENSNHNRNDDVNRPNFLP